MPEQPRAQFDVDAIGGVREQIGAQATEQRLEQRDRDQAHDDHVERGKPAMHQHLVDDDLEEQRRDQPERLQEQRDDQHLGQDPAVFMHRAHEPADVEPPCQIAERRAPGDEDHLAGPVGIELGPRPHLWLLSQDVEQQHPVRRGTQEQSETAIPRHRDRGQGCRHQPLVAHLRRMSLEAGSAGVADDFGRRGFVAAEGVPQPVDWRHWLAKSAQQCG